MNNNLREQYMLQNNIWLVLTVALCSCAQAAQYQKQALTSVVSSKLHNRQNSLALLDSVTHLEPLQKIIAGYLGWFYEAKKIPVVHEIDALVYEPKQTHIAGLSFVDGSIRIWDAHTYQLLRMMYIGHTNTQIGYSADSRFLWGANTLGIKKYSVARNYDSSTIFRYPGTSGIVPLPSGIMAHLANRELNIIKEVRSNAGRSSKIRYNCLEPIRKKNLLCTALHPSGTQLALGYSDYTVELYDDLPEVTKRTHINFEDRICCLSYSPDGKYLAAGTDNPNGRIILWNMEKPVHQQQPISFAAPRVFALTFSPDSNYLAAGSYNAITIWDLTTGALHSILSGHTDTICSLVYAPDGATLISGSCDNTVRIWKQH